MNESEILTYIEERLVQHQIFMTRPMIKVMLGLFCEAVLLGLKEQGRARLPKFGTFTAKTRRVATNFWHDGSITDIKCISFKPSRKFVASMRSKQTLFEQFENGQ